MTQSALSKIQRSCSSGPRRGHKPIPGSAYRFEKCDIDFSPQRSRAKGQMRPVTSSAFVAGNLQFVYKNCQQLSSVKDQNLLNDVLFSHCVHPNSGVEFELLFSVIAHQPDDFICPICMFEPVAPRMTHCGHIFCNDCIQAHLTINEPATCPICYKPLNKAVLVRTDLRMHPHTDHCCFKKIKRNRNNCVCFPVEAEEMAQLPTVSSPSAAFSRFTMADKTYIERLIESEKRDIAQQIETYKEYEDQRKNQMLEIVRESLETESHAFEASPHFDLLSNPNPKDFGYFYQDELGRLMFLDPLSNRMLKTHFNSIEEGPDVLEFKKLKQTYFTVDQKFRRRFPLLGHLPAGADVQMVLADLSDIVSKDVLDAFSQHLERRLKTDDDDEEPEPEPEKLSESDFPELSQPAEVPSAPQKPRRTVSAWEGITAAPAPALSSEEAFPRLGGPAKPAKKKTVWAKI